MPPFTSNMAVSSPRTYSPDFFGDGSRVWIGSQRRRDLRAIFRRKSLRPLFVQADSQFASNNAYGLVTNAAHLPGDCQSVRIAFQRLYDLRAFCLGNHTAIKAWGELDDKLAPLRHR